MQKKTDKGTHFTSPGDLLLSLRYAQSLAETMKSMLGIQCPRRCLNFCLIVDFTMPRLKKKSGCEPSPDTVDIYF